MSDFNNIGRLMHLPIKDIKPEENFSAPEFIVSAAAEAVLKADGRNWLPLIVKEVAEYTYQVISNSLVYTVGKKANLERIWCIVVDSNSENIEQTKILNGELVPKINLNIASSEDILSALKYLLEQPGSPLKGIDINKVTNKLAEADRANWKNFSEIPKLKCGITQGKKLEAIQQVFFLSPSTVKIEIPNPPEIISIKKTSRDDIFDRLNYLTNYKIDGFEKIDPDKAADLIFTATKSKWKSLNPIANLNCGIDKAKIKTLKTVLKI